MSIKPMKTIHRLLKMKTMVFRHFHVIRQSQMTHKIGRFDILECYNWVNIIGITKEGKVLFVKQYRHGIDEITLEIPGGVLDKGEDYLMAAKRELQEETGHTSDEWHFLGEVTPNPAFISNKCQTFLALNCEETHKLKLDPFEEIEVLLLEKKKVDDMLASGEIHHSLVVCAFFYYHLFKNKLK